ncbi:helix-turn-helix transcriptional regulator [Streptomyces aurantiacus]|uniref:HTH cro/C1-type domain-containing protein n=1 Tax=Streptomyces aurantiacus JA 4570 TaxID=1286094 RepID=S3ZP90_9ACTN|nr:helix-turn-helix transcriptional regulator [Streptomyces aurantiacus]EPH45331.1 hypothetical protein STRAU_1596 [Streptomyces aurantiacus JA 4570]
MAQAPRPAPTPEQRLFARRLRRLREDLAGMSLDSAAGGIGVSTATIRRIEGAEQSLDLDQVEKLLVLYGVSGARLTEMKRTAQAAARPGWWHQKYHRVMPRDVQEWIGLESAASLIRMWAPATIPDLLQTPEYARAVHRRQNPHAADSDLDLTVELLRQRQRRVAERGTRIWALMSAAALHTKVGSASVMRDQLLALRGILEQPLRTIQIVPLGSFPHPLTNAPPARLIRLGGGEADLGDYIVVDQITGTTIVTKPRESDTWRQAMDITCVQVPITLPGSSMRPSTLTPELTDL